jgi:septal ring factor EnvC (AmiA/AmiB activator)
MNKKLFYISFLCFLFSGMFGYTQTRKELENRRKKLNKEIEKVNDLLFKTKKEKTSALDDLKDINQKITVRERLIETIELETKELLKEINSNKHKLNKLNKELTVLKDDYADMVVKSYKSKSQQSKTMFLLSSKSFHQAYKRLKYMEQYKNYRKKQGEEIALKSVEIKAVNDSLKKQKKAKELLITSEQKQKKEIEGDKKEQEGLVSKIKKQESKYKRELEKKIKEEKALAKKIDKLIRDAIAKANKAKKGKAKKDELLLSAEEKTLKANFEQNKGNLPWPVNGLITRKFGVQPHPTFKGITINSTGLHIRGKSGDKAKTVFNGKVLAVQLLSKGRKAVLVQHGDYITAYNGLKEVFVNVGQKVKTGDALGKIFTDKVTGKTDLGFVLFKNINRLDPSDWIENR